MFPVSIIIPCHNRATIVPRALRSVVEQTFQDWECLLIDDGSTDCLASIGLKDSRLKLIRQDHAGVSSARNHGIRESRYDWICFLDSDDEWHPEKLFHQIHWHLNHPSILFSQTLEQWIRNNRRVNPARKHLKKSGWIFKESLSLCLISPSAVMIHRSLLDEIGFFDETLPACEDYDLWLRLLVRTSVGLIEKELVTRYGGHPDQLSGQPGLDLYRVLSLIKLIKETPLSADQLSWVQETLKEKSQIYLAGCAKRGHHHKEQELQTKLSEISII